MKHMKSILSIFFAIVLLFGSVPTAVFSSSESESLTLTRVDPTIDPRLPQLFEQEDDSTEPAYAPDDVVRVSIVLDDASALDKGYPVSTIGIDQAASAYQDRLCLEQAKVVDRIEETVLDGEELDVVTNLTLVANLVSADVAYAQIEEIEKIEGVKEVLIERVYEPLEGEQTTEEKVAAVEKVLSAYTGAGSRIAIIDSGVNDDHQSFDPDALNYSLQQSAPDPDGNGVIDEEELAAYKESIDFMTLDDVLDAVNTKHLHVLPEQQNAEDLYLNEKIPFAYNYSDFSLFTKNGAAGIHGSHVSGIAAANAYIPEQGEGAEKRFVKAEDEDAIVGTAPDAQILNLKVFGNVMCTDSVIAMAVEDALILGADVLNLSLGTAEVGFSCADSIFGDVFEQLTAQGVLIMGAVGNDGSWVHENKKDRPNQLYSDDVNLSLCTPPSSYADLMGVAWADGASLPSTVNESSAYGIPSSLMLQPEITAYGTQVNSVDGNTTNGYTALSGTSMASPDVAGAAAVIAQYLRAKQFDGSSFLNRALSQNEKLNQGMIVGGLLMSTADPMFDPDGNYYSLLRQGAGLLNTKRATEAMSFLEIAGQTRGRVKAEVGDCPDGSNTFHYTFTLHNVSDTERSYVFKTNLFTEDLVTVDGVDYLADKTRTLMGKATYTIDGVEIALDPEFSADVNRDGKTNADDAQALLDYITGKNDGETLDPVDLDDDGSITTYDAHLLLQGLKTSTVSVAANDSVTVDVELCVTEDLTKDYPKGAYLEGFTSVVPVAMGEAEADVTHTIPILGFCGNWSDPSMFDRNSFIESFNDLNDKVPYTQNPQSVYEINYLTYQDENGNLLKQTVNPFDNSSHISLENLSMNLDDTIRNVQLSLIRPAGAMCFAIMTRNEDGSRKVAYIDAVYIHQTCAFPSPNSTSGWSRATVGLPVRVTLRKMLEGTGIGEGDQIELGAVVVPEYYEETPGKTITRSRIKTLIENGELGVGAYLTTTVTLDNTAPEITGTEKVGSDADKKIRITAEDKQGIAYLGLFTGNGTYAFEKYIPDGTGKNASTVVELDTSKLQEGSTYSIVVGDYAGNRSMYRFTFGEAQTITDKVIAYIHSTRNGGGEINRGDWVALRPDRFSCDTIKYGNGFIFSCSDDSDVLAGADAADGYLWQAFEDGRLCASPISDVNAKQFICDLSMSGVKTVRDLAFHPKEKKLYAVDGSDTLWQIDPLYGDVKQMQQVTVSGKPASLYGLAIDNNGYAVATHYDESTRKSTLLSWKIAEGGTEEAKTCSLGRELPNAHFISLTWTSTSRTDLYAAYADNLGGTDMRNYLYKISSISFDNGYCSVRKANDGYASNASLLYGAVRGLVNLSAMPKLGLLAEGEAPAVEGLQILGAKSEMIAGDTAQLSVAISPWNAKFDTSGVEWQSSDEDTLTVSKTGLVTAVKAGEATVTANYETAEGVRLAEEYPVNVTAAPSIEVAALFCEGNGSYYWESFNTASPNERKRLAFSNAYTIGTLNHDRDSLYLFSGMWAYRVNPKDFTSVSLEASIDDQRQHADAAPGRTEGYYTNFGYLTIESNQTLLLGSRLGGTQKGFETVSVSMYLGRADVGTLAGIAYKGVDENAEDLGTYGSKDPSLADQRYRADVYYVVNESGDLFELYCYVAPRWYDGLKDEPGEYSDMELTYTKRLGHVDGVSLPGVGEMSNYATSSMIYDSETEKLVLVSKIGVGAAKVQVIDPETHSLVMTRAFDDDVRQVGVLYQYDYSAYPDINSTASNGANAVQTHAENPNVDVNEEEKTITYHLTAENATNGKITVQYDPNVLTFRGFSSEMPFHSYHVDGENGEITIAFADADEITPSAQITFAFEPQKAEQTTTLTITEAEKGDPKEHTPTERQETVTLPKKPVAAIEIGRNPDKTAYIEGQPFDPTGLAVLAVYTDGTKEPLEEGEYEIVIPDDFLSPGTHAIKVTYQGFVASFEVTVREKTVIGLTISKNPNKMEYIEGTPFDDAGMELTLKYDNGTTEKINTGWKIVSYDFSKIGKRDVVISYQGCETTLTVDVVAKSLVSISVSKNPNKMEYVEGTPFDDAGMELTLQYNNNTTETIDTGWKIISYDFSTPGQTEVTISYGGKTATLTVNVTQKTLTGIEITALPDKQVYLEASEALDLRGGKLTLRYDNGTTEEIPLSDEMVDGFDNTKPGKQTVTVTYGGFTATFDVTVQAKEIDHIEVTRRPDKTDYVEGTAFDPQGMEVTVHYNNGQTEVITDGWEITYTFDEVGTSDVQVSYQGHDTTLTVNVVAKSLTRVEITKMPDNTTYTENGKFDDAGMELTLYYDNGTTETVTEGWTAAYDFSVPGQRDVTVRFGGVETSFTVTVQASPQSSTVSDDGTQTESSESPQTGDDGHLYVWLLLLLASGGTLALLASRKRRPLSD